MRTTWWARPDGWWRDRTGALADLCDAAVSWRPATDKVIVVVDGWPGDAVPERHGRDVEVRYARRRGPDGADDAIVELLRASDDLAATVVVTSDARLRARVIDAGGDVVGAGTFRRWLDRDGPTAAPRPTAGGDPDGRRGEPERRGRA